MEQDEYSILNSKHFIGIHGYMLVYSVSSLSSFEMVQVIREKILNHLVCSTSPFFLFLFCLLYRHRFPGRVPPLSPPSPDSLYKSLYTNVLRPL